MATRSGNSIVEVLLAIGIASIVVASVSNLIVSVNQVDRLTAHRTQAQAYGKEALEIVASIQDQEFACSLGSGTGSCTRDGQTCTTATGYNSCWIAFPDDPSTLTVESGPLHLVPVSGTYELQIGTDTLGNYERSIVIENVPDPRGPNFYDTKKVSVTVNWEERGTPKTVTQETILSGWKNI